MEGFKLCVVTPEGCAFEGEVRSVTVRTTEGDIGILKNHTNFVSGIEYGMLKITACDGSASLASCMNGFVNVDAEQVRIIATTFEFAQQIDLERAKKARDGAAERLGERDRLTEDEIAVATARKRSPENRIHVYELYQ